MSCYAHLRIFQLLIIKITLIFSRYSSNLFKELLVRKMLSLVRTSLVLVSLLLVLRLSEALPMEEWLLSRSKRIDGVNYEQNPDVQRFDEESVNNEQSLDVQRFDEESYTR